jgi:hypothetical protein
MRLSLVSLLHRSACLSSPGQESSKRTENPILYYQSKPAQNLMLLSLVFLPLLHGSACLSSPQTGVLVADYESYYITSHKQTRISCYYLLFSYPCYRLLFSYRCCTARPACLPWTGVQVADRESPTPLPVTTSQKSHARVSCFLTVVAGLGLPVVPWTRVQVEDREPFTPLLVTNSQKSHATVSCFPTVVARLGLPVVPWTGVQVADREPYSQSQPAKNLMLQSLGFLPLLHASAVSRALNRSPTPLPVKTSKNLMLLSLVFLPLLQGSACLSSPGQESNKPKISCYCLLFSYRCCTALPACRPLDRSPGSGQ